MKLYITIAATFACLTSAYPGLGWAANQAKKLAIENNPISKENQEKIENAAKEGTKLAVSEARKYGVNINLAKIQRNLQNNYGKKVENQLRAGRKEVEKR